MYTVHYFTCSRCQGQYTIHLSKIVSIVSFDRDAQIRAVRGLQENLCSAHVRGSEMSWLFYSHTLGEIPRFVNIKSELYRYIIREQLERNDGETYA